jgi:addiction module HigA family antidote
MKKQINDPKEGIMTNRMDFGTKGFDEFQAIVLKKSMGRSVQQKRNIELLTIKYQMEDYLKSDSNDVKLGGEFLKLILKTLNIHQNRFADYIGLKPSNLSKLISGERSINYNLALIFGRLFNHDPMLWIEIQAKNELRRLLNAQKSKYRDYSLSDLVIDSKSVNTPASLSMPKG